MITKYNEIPELDSVPVKDRKAFYKKTTWPIKLRLPLGMFVGVSVMIAITSLNIQPSKGGMILTSYKAIIGSCFGGLLMYLIMLFKLNTIDRELIRDALKSRGNPN